jgi:hypothetical protein
MKAFAYRFVMVVAISFVLIIVAPVGSTAHFVPIASIIVSALVILHFPGYWLVKRAQRRATSFVWIAITSYLTGVLAVGVGGMLWTSLVHGWGRTNASGYLVWCWVYGAVYFLPSLFVGYYLYKPLMPTSDADRGFEVVQRNRGGKLKRGRI